MQEKHGDGAHLGQNVLHFLQAAVKRGEEPRPTLLGGEQRLLKRWPRVGFGGGEQFAEKRGRVFAAPCAQSDVASGRESFGRVVVEQDFPFVGQLFHLGHFVQRIAHQHIQQLNIGVADDEAAGRACGDGHFDGQRDGRASGSGEVGERGHGRLHGQSAGDGGAAVIPIKPAGNRIPGKGDDHAPILVNAPNQAVVDFVEVLGEQFRPLFGAKFV